MIIIKKYLTERNFKKKNIIIMKKNIYKKK